MSYRTYSTPPILDSCLKSLRLHSMSKFSHKFRIDYLSQFIAEAMANQIQPITRRNIFDFIQAEGIWWHGRLEEINFLTRVFDLEQMESYDHRFPNAASDIWQHRVNNPNDWPDDWIFNDKRFDLIHGDDSIFLNFICEMVHPLVRPDSTEVAKMTQLYNDALAEDNFEIVEKSRLGGKPIFAGRLKITGKDSIVQKGRDIKLYPLCGLNSECMFQPVNISVV